MASGYVPYTKVNLKDESYNRNADIMGLPQFAKKFMRDYQLEFWDGELNIVSDDSLWVNLNVNGSWLLEYQTKINWLIPASGKTPFPRPSSKLEFSGKRSRGAWTLRCTNLRLVTYSRVPSLHAALHQEDLHVIICFPWSMFSCVACPPYAKDSLFFGGGMRHYVRVVFERENKSFHLAFGDYDFIEARDHATALCKAALKAKIECAKRLLDHYRASLEKPSELETKALALIAKFEEQSKTPVSIDDKGTYVCQTYYETLDPMLYFRLMKKNA